MPRDDLHLKHQLTWSRGRRFWQPECLIEKMWLRGNYKISMVFGWGQWRKMITTWNWSALESTAARIVLHFDGLNQKPAINRMDILEHTREYNGVCLFSFQSTTSLRSANPGRRFQISKFPSVAGNNKPSYKYIINKLNPVFAFDFGDADS